MQASSKPIYTHEYYLILSKTELDEIIIAFNHMLGLSFYTNTQQERVQEMKKQLMNAAKG